MQTPVKLLLTAAMLALPVTGFAQKPQEQKPEEVVQEEPAQKPPVQQEPIQEEPVEQNKYAMECSRNGLWRAAQAIADDLEEAYDEFEDAAHDCLLEKQHGLRGEQLASQIDDYMAKACTGRGHYSEAIFRAMYSELLANQNALSNELIRARHTHVEINLVNDLFDSLTAHFHSIVGEP